MPKFDENIRSAIASAVKESGSQAALCKRVGISPSILSRYIKGNVKKINVGTWNLLVKALAKYLPEHYQVIFPPVPKETIEAFSQKHPESAHFFSLHEKTLDELDFADTYKTSPLFLCGARKINTINVIKERLPYLSERDLDNILIMILQKSNIDKE